MKTALIHNGLKRKAQEGRAGAILGMMLVIVLAISVIGLSLLHRGAVNAIEVSRTVNSDQAFWSAEAGLQHARAMLLGNTAVRHGFFPYLFSRTDMGYGGRIVSADNVNFGIVSTGSWQNAVRMVQQSVRVDETWPGAFDYAIYSGNTMELRGGTTVTGDIFADNGYRFVSGGPSVSGGIYDDVTGGTYPAPPAVPVPPVLDTSSYNAVIATAAAAPVTTPVYPWNLGNHTNYLNSTSLNVGGRIDGPGVLVVSGDISISSGSAVIGNNVTLISGGMITIDKDCSSGSNILFYANSGFDLAKNNTVAIGSSALVTPGNINIKKELTFSGLIYAGGAIDSDKTMTVTGAIVAVGSVRLKMDAVVTYDDTLLPYVMFPGIEPEVRMTDAPWSEIFL